jgi:hypothetical protein
MQLQMWGSVNILAFSNANKEEIFVTNPQSKIYQRIANL